MVRFGMLGPLEARGADGEALPLGGPRQRAVLARLLVDAGRVVPAERVIEDVWDGRPPPTAHKTLQKYVSELRKALGPTLLRTAGPGYLVDLGGVELDVERFEALVAAHRFDEALALWRGDVLADVPDAAFVDAERTRLGERRLFAVEGRFDEALCAGRHADVVGELAEQAAAHPLRERLTAHLMLALYRSGRQVEALRAFARHRRRLADDVGVEPAPALRELEAAILRQDPTLDGTSAPADRAPPTCQCWTLPLPLTSFVGRADELAAVGQAIERHRLVTLTGPGGVGKTRLALELAGRLVTTSPSGLLAVDLAAATSADAVLDAVVQAAGADVRHSRDVLSGLAAALSSRPDCLLLLDNCEHVAAACAGIVAELLRRCPGLRVLATSRCPVGVDGELVRPVSPLTDGEAVALFVDRAHLAGVDDVAADDALRAICRRLDGLPLAIELAASQLRALSLAEIAARLDHQLRFHRAGAGSSRQGSLDDMVWWSYNLLPPRTQRLFARLGVFASSLTLAGAEAVGGDEVIDRRDVLAHVTTLVDHSLLGRDRTASASTTRYRLLETLRIFARERLAEQGAEASARRAHADHMIDLAMQAGPHLIGPDEETWRQRLEVEEPNIQAALTWAATDDPATALRLGVALWPYWDMRWNERHAVPYLAGVLADPRLDVSDTDRAWGQVAMATMAGNHGDARHALPWSEEAVCACRRLGNDDGLINALLALGSALGNRGAHDDAERALDEALVLARRRGDVVAETRALDRLYFVALRRGHHDRAAELSRTELARARQLRSTRGEATALRHVAVALQHLGQLTDAAALCHAALAIWEQLDSPAAVAHVVTTLADIARIDGRLDEATQLYQRAASGLQAVDDRRCTASTYKNLAAIAARRGSPASSRELFRQSVALRDELGDEAGLAECFEGLAAVEGDAVAVTLLAAAAALRARTGSLASADETTATGAVLARARAQLGADAFAAANERGRSASVAEAVAVALGDRALAG